MFNNKEFLRWMMCWIALCVCNVAFGAAATNTTSDYNAGLVNIHDLRSANGPFSFQSLQGKVAVLFFGYTHCPDVCPQDLSIIARAYNSFDAKQQAKLKVVFVSVDPERDDVKTLQEFTRYFNPNFIGVTGSAKAIANLAKRFNVHYKKVPVPGSKTEYSMQHTASTYILDAKGQISAVLPSGISDLALQQAITFVFEAQHS